MPTFFSPLLNHIWQSTLIAAVAGLLALVLRTNHARARYWLWLTASLKFLIPFSLFVAIGSHVSWSTASFPATQSSLSVVEEVSQPFTSQAASLPSRFSTVTHGTNPLPFLLVAIWICGFLVVLFTWLRRWMRIRAALRAASPISLQQTEIPVLSSSELLEPGVFGIFRPVLVLPEGITEHLAPTQLKAILAHELCHIRRRDNLAAVIHMLVETIFWFDPLVWWIGAKLVEERERACDEEVLARGNRPETYAESILKVCQFYLESPLACMSGVTGSDLKKRIVRIMTQRVSHKLDFSRKLLLSLAATAAIAAPIFFGLLNATPSRAQSQASAPAETRPSFEVASVKPDHSTDNRMMIGNSPGMFRATNVTLKMLVRIAYQVQDREITGGPAWINSDRFDIEAKTGSASGDIRTMTEEQREAEMQTRRLMLQSLLADRFQLKISRETKELPIYALVVAKNGPKLKEVAPQPLPANLPPDPEAARKAGFKGEGMRMGRGELSGQAVPLSMLADTLSNQLDRPVIDRTGLKGHYDFTLQWTPDEHEGQMFRGPGPGDAGAPPPDAPPPPETTGPSIFTAIQEQLGLKLEPTKGPADVLVIDHAEKPSEN